MNIDTSVLVIGTGFAGLGMGIRLKQAGLHDFVIFEQADAVGGTWRDNHYPGAACDVPSYLYSFSFEPNPGWTRSFGEQAEILAYLSKPLRRQVRLAAAHPIQSRNRSRGVRRAGGALGSKDGGRTDPARARDRVGVWRIEPAVLSGHRGALHVSRKDLPLGALGITPTRSRGKRVGVVIGTGGQRWIQIVPAIAPKVGALQVFQRTPPGSYRSSTSRFRRP